MLLTTANPEPSATGTSAPPPETTSVTKIPAAHSFGGQNNGGAKSNNAHNGKNQKLQKVLSDKQMKELEALQKAYDSAPDWLKPKIQAAIDAILNGYDTSINNLDQ